MSKSKGLYTVSDDFQVVGIDLDGIEGKGMVYFATPEEIKASHPTCDTCMFYAPHQVYCSCPLNMVSSPLPTDYCNYHEPKET